MEQLLKVRFIPECHADTLLVKWLTNDFPFIDHEAGINNVAANFINVVDQTFKLIGVIDDDKRTPPYLDDFQRVKSANAVSLKKKPGHEHYVIVVSPALEKFIISNCQMVGITLPDFNLPDNLKQLTKITKKPHVSSNTNINDLLMELKRLSAPGIVSLETFLREFLQ